MAELRVTVYGGAAGEIGGNRILLETDEGNWLLDFGTRFGETAKYFEEFVKPRCAALGLRDYLRMGLLPPVEGLYRDDLSCHEPDLWQRYRSHPHYRQLGDLRGVLLSHAHVDHNGCLGFLKPEIPVYTGLTTAIIGKCLQDPKPTGPDGELCYVVPREHNGAGVLGATRNAPRQQRKHYICESGDDIERAMRALQPFWASVPGERTSIDAAPLELAEPHEFGVKFWRVDHSIPGSGAFAIRTSIGWVVYSGDLRMHGHSRWRTEAFARAAAALDPALLIIEGTRVDQEPSVTEPEVHQAVDDVVARTEGLVIADFSARNIERLRTFRDVAKARARRLVITTKDAYLLARLNLIDPQIPSPDAEGLAILREPQGTVPNWEKEIHHEFAAHFVDASGIRREPGGYILCLSYWDICNLVDLELDGGTYIYSSSEAYSEEQRVDQERLLNWLRHFGFRVVGGLPGGEEGPYHASGHIDGASLERLIEDIAPKRILPVHTAAPEWFQRRWDGKVVVARYGETIVAE
jgi:ribonuclease J